MRFCTFSCRGAIFVWCPGSQTTDIFDLNTSNHFRRASRPKSHHIVGEFSDCRCDSAVQKIEVEFAFLSTLSHCIAVFNSAVHLCINERRGCLVFQSGWTQSRAQAYLPIFSIFCVCQSPKRNCRDDNNETVVLGSHTHVLDHARVFMQDIVRRNAVLFVVRLCGLSVCSLAVVNISFLQRTKRLESYLLQLQRNVFLISCCPVNVH